MTVSTKQPVAKQRLVSAPLLGISLAYFMVLLDITVLAVAAPDMIDSLRSNVVGVGWANTSYTIALAASLVLAGSVADRFGPGRLFRLGAFTFGVLSLACALSPNIETVVALRALLGFSAAAVIPSSMALIARLHQDTGMRAQALSIWAAVSGAAMATGPVLGGVLVQNFGWRSVFVINAPLAVVVLAMTIGPRLSSARQERRLDPAPHLLLALFLAVGTYTITEAGLLHGFNAAMAGAVALILLGLAVWSNQRSDAPIVPEALRGNRIAWVTFAWGAFANYALTTILFVIPLTLDRSATAAGVALLPLTIVMAFNPLITGKIIAKRGPHFPIRLGMVALTIGTVLLVVSFVDTNQPMIMAVALLACGFGMSWTLPALVAFAVSQISSSAAGSVGGIMNATRQIGATVGAAAAAALITALPHGGGTQIALGIAASLGLVGAISALTIKS